MTYELYHHGILGQRWGVRRFQNKDGSLTYEGHKRLSGYSSKAIDSAEKGNYKKAAKIYLKGLKKVGRSKEDGIAILDSRWAMQKRDAANVIKLSKESGKKHLDDDDKYFVNSFLSEASVNRRLANAMRKIGDSKVKKISSKQPDVNGVPFEQWIKNVDDYSNQYFSKYYRQKYPGAF